MGEINRVFSENGINITAQYLQTLSDIGYVVIDVESEYSELALTQLRSVEGTLRCRVLF
jgi:D-3-phosphoglycerate dehydrogenase